jgi:hypothetical protein
MGSEHTTTADAAPPPVGRLSWRADLATCLLSTWLVAGVFVDGWAHNTRPNLETFFTPWHALFYSGFAATAVWIGSTLREGIRSGLGLRRAAPAGYGWAAAGLVLFATSGVGDLTWHQLFGIEQDTAALLSPTHLGLLCGSLLIVTAPWRSARADPELSHRPALGRLFPAALSVGLAGSAVAFMLQEWHPIKENLISAGAHHDLVASYAGRLGEVSNLQIRTGVASFVLATMFLFGPLLLLLRSWALPRGAAFLVLGLQCVLMQSQTGFNDSGLALLGVVGAVAVEVLLLVVRPSPDDLGRLRIFFLLAPTVFWGVYVLGILAADGHLGWKAELWGGSLVWSGLTMLGLATLASLATVAPLPPRTAPMDDVARRAQAHSASAPLQGDAPSPECAEPVAPLSSGRS